ncbi:MAG: DUF192 domain-containing protein [Bacteroidia bacterium]|nr:DUF192 domain-containing protein [Bacteroidia bacterium]NNF31128.1 DUF192 domain-containing protein [Flavobacteriaceae bacterium]MBT8275814.1 DUF192 domain-containing protein [Bacteroidia bacterium]NNJ81506.1 DUF192 domain-containing protein [Flavobacteriaceae bacterium]NNK55590.1 DUF192 domain-containing protein [Flavobacteriaceae bacterium]
MKRLLMLAAIICLANASGSCNETKEEKSITKEVRFQKEGELTLTKTSNDSVVATLEIEIAEGEYETQTGLMYRKSMQDDRGMLFIFDDEIRRSFYMKNTEFALDIIFINSENEIVNIQKNAQPLDQTSLPSAAPAKYVLEVNAGLCDKWTLEAGDRIEWNRL